MPYEQCYRQELIAEDSLFNEVTEKAASRVTDTIANAILRREQIKRLPTTFEEWDALFYIIKNIQLPPFGVTDSVELKIANTEKNGS